MRTKRYYELSWAGYRRAFGDCSEWLAQYFLPWRWVVEFYEACQFIGRSAAEDTKAPV